MYITGLSLYLETWKNLEFDNLGKNKLEKPEILNKNLELKKNLTCLVVKF